MIDAETGSILIPRLQKSLIDYVKERVKNTTNWTRLWFLQGYNFVETPGSDSGSKTLAAIDKDANVVYFVEHTPMHAGPLRTGRQVLVWSSNELLIPKFSQYVFFEYLLPKYGALIADEEQTAKGAAMWGNAMDKALEDKMFVYLADFKHSPPAIWQVLNDRHLDIVNLVRIGGSDRHRKMLPVISTKQIAGATPIPTDADINFLVNTI